jgi:hypothetical protein
VPFALVDRVATRSPNWNRPRVTTRHRGVNLAPVARLLFTCVLVAAVVTGRAAIPEPSLGRTPPVARVAASVPSGFLVRFTATAVPGHEPRLRIKRMSLTRTGVVAALAAERVLLICHLCKGGSRRYVRDHPGNPVQVKTPHMVVGARTVVSVLVQRWNTRDCMFREASTPDCGYAFIRKLYRFRPRAEHRRVLELFGEESSGCSGTYSECDGSAER